MASSSDSDADQEALGKLLRNLSGIYNDGDQMDVCFGSNSSVSAGGKQIIGEVDNEHTTSGRGAHSVNELRMYIDRLSHNVEHYRESDLAGKQEMGEAFPTSPPLAGYAYNLVEDAHVDKNRTDRFRGLRRTAAFRSDAIMDTRPSIETLDQPEAMVEAFFQVSVAGYVKGIENVNPDGGFFSFGGGDLSEEDIQCIAHARERIDEARRETDYERRKEISHDLAERLIEQVDDVDEAEEYLSNLSEHTGDLPDGALHSQLDAPGGDNSPPEEEESSQPDASSGSQEGAESGTTAGSGPTGDASGQPGGSGGFTIPRWARWLGIGAGVLGLSILAYAVYSGMIAWWVAALVLLAALLLLWLLSKLFTPPAGAAGSAGAQGPQQQGQGQGQGDGQGSQGEQSDGDQTESEDGSPADESADSDSTEGDREFDQSEADQKGGEDSQADTETDEYGGEASVEDVDLSDLSEDQLEDAIEEMMDQSASEESRDWHDVDEDVDYGEASEEMVEYFEQLRDMETADWGQLEEERDKQLQDARRPVDEIEKLIRERGLEREIEEAFRELKTRDRDVRAKTGQRLNTRAVTRYKSGDRSVEDFYYRRKKAETGDRAIGVAVDLSGSMDAQQTQIALGALGKAVDIIGDDLLVRGFANSGAFRGDATSNGSIQTPLITGPDEGFEFEHLNMVRTGGKTPTGAGIRATRQLLRRASRPEKVLICITDGYPNITSTGHSGTAENEALHEVRRCKEEGIKVIGMGLGDVDEATMDKMFEGDYVMVSEDTLAEELKDIYRSQMSVA